MSTTVEPIDSLLPASYNPRSISAEAMEGLKASIKRFGQVQQIVRNTRTGHIVGGHQRVQAMKALGIERVEVKNVDLSDAEEKALNVALNSPAISGVFTANLNELLDEIKGSMPVDYEAMLLDQLRIPTEIVPAEGLCDPDEVPEAPAEPKTKFGDLYRLGEHRLLCGDSTNVQHVERLMDGEKADMVFTDPPYNIAYEGGTKKRTLIENDNMDGGEFYQFLVAIYTNLFAVMAPGASIYVSHADMERVNFTKAFVDAGFHLSSIIIWAKNNATFGRQDYFWKHEPILYGWNSDGAHKWYGPTNEETIWEIDRPSRSEEHPTMKPVALVERSLKNSSLPGHSVLDVFGGSGTTLLACETLKRKAKLLELDPRYVDVIVSRWEKFTGKKAELING